MDNRCNMVENVKGYMKIGRHEKSGLEWIFLLFSPFPILSKFKETTELISKRPRPFACIFPRLVFTPNISCNIRVAKLKRISVKSIFGKKIQMNVHGPGQTVHDS